jgi:hypothetical protein
MAWIAFVCLGCAGGCAMGPSAAAIGTGPGPTILADPLPEEDRVYAALLECLYVQNKATALTGDGNRIGGGRGPVIDQVVLADRTIDLRLFPDLPDTADDQKMIEDSKMDAPELLKGCTAELLGAFRQANRKPARLVAKNVKAAGLEVISIALDEGRYMPMPPVPDALLYQRYPRCQGITILSRVGFSGSGDTAVILTGTMRATLFGHGSVFLLEKKGDRWRIVEEALVWLS